jgi:hypothetical protein
LVLPLHNHNKKFSKGKWIVASLQENWMGSAPEALSKGFAASAAQF